MSGQGGASNWNSYQQFRAKASFRGGAMGMKRTPILLLLDAIALSFAFLVVIALNVFDVSHIAKVLSEQYMTIPTGVPLRLQGWPWEDFFQCPHMTDEESQTQGSHFLCYEVGPTRLPDLPPEPLPASLAVRSI